MTRLRVARAILDVAPARVAYGEAGFVHLMRAFVVILMFANAFVAPASAEVVIEDVKLDEPEEPIGYRNSAWLLALPVLFALVIAWNVDWRDARVKAEIANARAQRAPKPKGGAR